MDSAIQFSRFLNKIYLGQGECWLWSGTRGRGGYGYVSVRGRRIRAHRWSYEYFFEESLGKDLACHACDVPACVNPFHLFRGTYLDNNRDTHLKGRAASQKRTHCVRGHLLAGENLERYKASWRACKKCRIIRDAKRWEKHRDEILAYRKRYAEENKDAIYRRARRWRDANPARARDQQKKYRERNAEKLRARATERRRLLAANRIIVPKKKPTHCSRGHEYTEENMERFARAKGRLLCRACRRLDRAKKAAMHGPAIKEYNRNYQRQNKDKIRSNGRAWLNKNRERSRAYKNKWQNERRRQLKAAGLCPRTSMKWR